MRTKLIFHLLMCLLCFGALVSARADDDLKTIKFSDTAQIIYGPLAAKTSDKDALVAMLHRMHDHFGEKPQVGKIFADKKNQSIATYFNVADSNNQGRKYSGLVIVSVPKGGQPRAVAIFDDAQKFPKTANQMLQNLQQIWAPKPDSAPGKKPAADNASAADIPPMHTVNFPDGSGSVDLPDGWKLIGAPKGKMDVVGPNGEKMLFGVYLPVISPSNRQLVQLETGNGRRPAPGLETIVPYNDDPVEAFKAVSAKLAEKQHRQPPSIEVTKVTPIQSQGPGKQVILLADMDFHDGKGVAAATMLLRMGPPKANGMWSIFLNQVLIPKELAARESPITGAISRSVRINDQVILAEQQSELKAHAAYTDAVLQRGRDIQAANDAQHESVRAKWDADDKQSQAFSNYLLDRAVISGTGDLSNAHETVDSDYAARLVTEHPDQFQYVPTQNYLKGRDY
jgi:hypothetical protein